ncbi:hypothetical protein Hdeb2414_s0007g00231351 [Helianthus debilis subsp. tardiflorus]
MWASVTNQHQSEPKMARNLYGDLVPVAQLPAICVPTTDLYGNPLPPVASQRYRSTVEPSSLDPRNCSQTKTALHAEIVKDASNGESSGNNNSFEHDQMKMFQLQLRMMQLQVQARMDLNVNHQGRLLILMQKDQHLRVIPVRMFQEELLIVLGLLIVERPCIRSAT